MHWRPSTIPELSHLTPPQRKHILRGALSFRWWSGLVRRCALSGLLGAGVALLAFALLKRGAAGALDFTAVGAAFCAGALCGYRLQLHWLRQALRRGMVDALDGESTPVCLACGYDLTGHEGAACPECGRGRVWR
ncbi:MAG: hypothetical protein ACYTGR_13475 [Planctomycetota bacterium]|jgi:hypothetical protein